MKFKNELEFQTFCLKALKQQGRFVRNIPDIGNTKKPFDASGNYLGRGVALEFKHSKNVKEPSADHFRKKLYPHQIASLIEFEGDVSLGLSYVICSWDKYIYIYMIHNNHSQLLELARIEADQKRLGELLSDLVSNYDLTFESKSV